MFYITGHLIGSQQLSNSTQKASSFGNSWSEFHKTAGIEIVWNLQLECENEAQFLVQANSRRLFTKVKSWPLRSGDSSRAHMYKPTSGATSKDKESRTWLKKITCFPAHKLQKCVYGLILAKWEGILNLGVMGSFIYALMLDTGSWNAPSAKVGFSFPSYSNLLNMSWNNFAFINKNLAKNYKAEREQ